jgi:hypothetical protein
VTPLVSSRLDTASMIDQSYWSETSRPCKEEWRKMQHIDIEKNLFIKVESILDLCGSGFYSAKHLKDFCEGNTDTEKYARIYTVERVKDILELMKRNNPGVNIHPVIMPLSLAFNCFKKYRENPFSIVNADYCGAYCAETEMFLENMFHFQSIAPEGLLYMTLGNLRCEMDKPSVQRVNDAMLQFSGYHYKQFDTFKYLYSALPYVVMQIATESGYGVEVTIVHSYSDSKATMFNYGFLVHRMDDPQSAYLFNRRQAYKYDSEYFRKDLYDSKYVK